MSHSPDPEIKLEFECYIPYSVASLRLDLSRARVLGCDFSFCLGVCMISRVEDSYTTWNHTKITLVSGDRELGVWVQGLKFKHTTVPQRNFL